MSLSRISRLALAAAALAATPAAAQTQPKPGVNAFEPGYFARVQPTSAYEMIQILPRGSSSAFPPHAALTSTTLVPSGWP
jgi:hypothetical protein